MSGKITAWLSIGSTYTYLTALRIKGVVQTSSIDLTIRPISIRQIMKSMDNIPFPPSKKSKVDYMWRDIQRRARFYGLPIPKVPAPYPLKEFDRANHVGIIMNQQGHYLEYLEHTYRLWFVDGLEAGSEENLQAALSSMGLDFDEIIGAASNEAINDEYINNTHAAQESGVFGAPSFSVGGEIFWGDDRLEDAIRFSAPH
ncbi:MAG: 2-hydroxychromene-2-carboxylate isomerase [Rhodospirillaceae bacterium]|nr:2-hydroxychromene-2-carboxylate isomerase [Rhodospirillaceae bacterium]|tara:strand:- start:307 stop:906 length:600 start_codon:yes stop_codon:yes gene_type:complete